jgi:iron complex outermembrane receptor protein
MHIHFLRRGLCAVVGGLLAVPVLAQPLAASEVVITGNPLGREQGLGPVSSMARQALQERATGSIGETLNGLPGVGSSYFGPNASRPVIRGLDGNRVRILSNGGATTDASALSPDHAVPIEVLAVDRIEVLRGPAALLYGGSAIGGVVNVIDNRLPRQRLQSVQGEVRLQTATGLVLFSAVVVIAGRRTRRGASHASASRH